MPDRYFNFEFLLIFKKQLFLSVDYFFLLSGYLITSKYQHLPFNNVFIFIKKRFFRLYPLLFFTSLLFCLILILRYNFYKISSDDQIFIFSKSNYIISLLDNLFLTSSTKILGSLNLINTPTWSVSAEFICYFFFGIQLLLVKKLRYISAVFFFVFSIYLLFDDNKIFSTTTFGYARAYVGFFIGGLIFNIKTKIYLSNFYLSFFSVISGLIAVFCSSILESKFSSHLFIFLFIANSFFWFTLLNEKFKAYGILSKFFIFLGSISYSVYLNHFIVILVVDRLFGNITHHSLLVIITFFLIFLISYYTNKYIENKFRIFS
jgi:peptidoglycan/LPS O-acetylase OafA/YrhL